MKLQKAHVLMIRNLARQVTDARWKTEIELGVYREPGGKTGHALQGMTERAQLLRRMREEELAGVEVPDNGWLDFYVVGASARDGSDLELKDNLMVRVERGRITQYCVTWVRDDQIRNL